MRWSGREALTRAEAAVRRHGNYRDHCRVRPPAPQARLVGPEQVIPMDAPALKEF